MCACVFCVMSNSHQRESPGLSSPVWLRERIQPSMWLHLCSHLRVSILTHKHTLSKHSVCLSRIFWPEFIFTVLLASLFDISFSLAFVPESQTKPRCSASSRQTWAASSLAPWSTRSSPPAWPSSTATLPRLSNPSRTFDTKS